jgi:hypothetical protein
MNNNLRNTIKLNLVLPFLTLFFFKLTFAQTSPIIIKSYPFYTISPSNNSPKGGGVNEVIAIEPDTTIAIAEVAATQSFDTQYIIYVETTTLSIRWQTAKQGVQYFQINAIPVTVPFNAGMLNGEGQFLITVKKGNYLNALYLRKRNSTNKIESYFTTESFFLKATNKNKIITFKTGVLKELFPVPPA